MLSSTNFTQTPAFKKLKAHHRTISKKHLKELFAEDKNRFKKFSIKFNDILLDYSKNTINRRTIAYLTDLAKECDLSGAIEQMFSGEKINQTENRSVLHVALRNRSNTPILVDGKDVMPDVNEVLEKMKEFSGKVISGGMERLYKQSNYRYCKYRNWWLGFRAGYGYRGIETL